MANAIGSRTIAFLGIFSAVIGAAGGTASNYYFGQRGAMETERRTQRLEAYLNYLTFRDSKDASKQLPAIYRVLVFGRSEVVEKMATAVRASARVRYNEEAVKTLRAKMTVESADVVEKWAVLFQSMRDQYDPRDKISTKDLKTVLCPNPGPCLDGYDVRHLFE